MRKRSVRRLLLRNSAPNLFPLLGVFRLTGAFSSLTVHAIAIEFHKPIQSTSETRQTTAG